MNAQNPAPKNWSDLDPYLKAARLITAEHELMDALTKLYSSFQHDGNGRTKGNQAKADIIKYNDGVKVALTAARLAIAKAEGK